MVSLRDSQPLNPQHVEGCLYLSLGGTFRKTFQSSTETTHVSCLAELYSSHFKREGFIYVPGHKEGECQQPPDLLVGRGLVTTQSPGSPQTKDLYQLFS